jgi:hypothetical protein
MWRGFAHVCNKELKSPERLTSAAEAALADACYDAAGVMPLRKQAILQRSVSACNIR